MKLDQDLLDILRCPETKQTLSVADDALLEKINAAIAGGTLVNRGGEKIDEPADGALVREDGQVAYLVHDDVPEMLIDASIELAAL